MSTKNNCHTKIEPFRLIFGVDPEYAMKLVARLTPRETEIVERIAMGMTNEEISNDLQISLGTISFHWKSFRKKLETTTLGIPRVWFCAKICNAVKELNEEWLYVRKKQKELRIEKEQKETPAVANDGSL